MRRQTEIVAVLGLALLVGCGHGSAGMPDDGGAAEVTDAPRACLKNADCPGGQVCFIAGVDFCQQATAANPGRCVTRMGPAFCGQGTVCSCIDITSYDCNPNIGSYCTGADDPQSCWYCHVPI
jgi:hypothetical protein